MMKTIFSVLLVAMIGCFDQQAPSNYGPSPDALPVFHFDGVLYEASLTGVCASTWAVEIDVQNRETGVEYTSGPYAIRWIAVDEVDLHWTDANNREISAACSRDGIHAEQACIVAWKASPSDQWPIICAYERWQ